MHTVAVASRLNWSRALVPRCVLIVPTPLEQFQTISAAWLPYVEWASVVAVGVKSQESLQLIAGRANLYRGGAVPEPEFTVETEHIFALRRFIACSPDCGRAFIDEANRGRLVLQGTALPFELRGAELRIFAHPIRMPGIVGDVRVPACTVVCDHKFAALHPVGGLESADWELRGHDPPYYGLDEVLISLGLPAAAAMGDFARLDVAMAPPAIIVPDGSNIRDGKASVQVAASARLQPENVRVSVKGFPRAAGSGEPRVLTFASRERVKEGTEELWLFEGHIGDESTARAFLVVNGLAVNQFWITDPSRRMHAAIAATEAFDDALALLDQHLLNARGDQAERFEWAVGVLLTLLGFRVIRLGKGTPITDGPDLLAMTVTGQVCVVECTLGHPDNKDKVAKVIQRAARVRERLNKSGFGSPVLQVVATPLSKSELRDASAEALRRGVLVLGRETLADLRQRANFPADPDRIFNEGIAALSWAGEAS